MTLKDDKTPKTFKENQTRPFGKKNIVSTYVFIY